MLFAAGHAYGHAIVAGPIPFSGLGLNPNRNKFTGVRAVDHCLHHCGDRSGGFCFATFLSRSSQRASFWSQSRSRAACLNRSDWSATGFSEFPVCFGKVDIHYLEAPGRAVNIPLGPATLALFH
jgi:hypothetical protein